MMRRFTMFILIIIIFSTNIITFANQDNQSIPQQDIEFEKLLMDEKSNQLIIKFGEGINLMSREDTLTKHSITSKDMSELAYKTKLVKVEDANLEDLIQDLEADPSIEYVEKNYIYKQSSRPNDTYYDNLWHLRNIDAEGAWDQVHQTGQEVVVAVIDSGIDDRHRDLVNRIVPGGYNFLCDNTSIYDFDGHGTFISGIISAEYNNNYGITGLAGNSNIKILPLRVTNHEGIANSGDIIRAIDYSISKNVDVINLSLGGPDYSNSLNDAIQRAINANIVVVAASGNDALIGNKISYPASYNGVISVGATDIHNNRSAFSNYNDFVDLVAPGEQLLSTSPANNFELGSGTSYSTKCILLAVIQVPPGF